jgi:hypothetical protein
MVLQPKAMHNREFFGTICYNLDWIMSLSILVLRPRRFLIEPNLETLEAKPYITSQSSVRCAGASTKARGLLSMDVVKHNPQVQIPRWIPRLTHVMHQDCRLWRN